MYKQRGFATVFGCLVIIAVCGWLFTSCVNSSVYNKYIERCIQNGGTINTETRYVDEQVGDKLIRVPYSVQVCNK